jgi:hypothetical protein
MGFTSSAQEKGRDQAQGQRVADGQVGGGALDDDPATGSELVVLADARDDGAGALAVLDIRNGHGQETSGEVFCAWPGGWVTPSRWLRPRVLSRLPVGPPVPGTVLPILVLARTTGAAAGTVERVFVRRR